MTTPPHQATDRRNTLRWKVRQPLSLVDSRPLGYCLIHVLSENGNLLGPSIAQVYSPAIAEHIVELHNASISAPGALDPHTHYVTFDDNGWTVQHSIDCRNSGQMMSCDYLKAVRMHTAALTGPRPSGLYRIERALPFHIESVGTPGDLVEVREDVR